MRLGPYPVVVEGTCTRGIWQQLGLRASSSPQEVSNVFRNQLVEAGLQFW